MFWQNQILTKGRSVPLGQACTDILNISDDTLVSINDSRNELVVSMQKLFNASIKKDLADVTEIQSKLNKVLDICGDLPPFSHLIDRDFGKSMLIDIFNSQPQGFLAMTNRQTKQGEVLYHFIFTLLSIIDETISFKKYIDFMLEYYFERLKKRNEEHYAIGVFSFFSNTDLINDIRATMPPLPSFDFMQTRQIGIEYAPIRNPDNEKKHIIAERIVFNRVGAFLHADLFRGFMHGHCPRKCHNCGTYFLLLSGHNTCYCANISPTQKKKGQTKTCREIGAHIKETKKKEKMSPAKQEYHKVYNRLKTRKNRGNITTDEWNMQVAQAISYMEQNEIGKLSDFEYMEIMKKF